MEYFIKLTSICGHPEWINEKYIVSIYKDKDDDYTTIHTVKSYTMVKETPEEILNKIQNGD